MVIMNRSSSWVACQLVVCVPGELLKIASEAVQEARHQLMQDPVLAEVAFIAVRSYRRQDRTLGFQADPLADIPGVAGPIYDAVIDAVRVPPLATAPAVVFSLLIVDRTEELTGILADVAAHPGISGLPVEIRSLVVDSEIGQEPLTNEASLNTVLLKQEILESISSALEKAEVDEHLSLLPGSLLYQPSSKSPDEVVGNGESLQKGASTSLSALQQALSKARSQLAWPRLPTAPEAIDRASENKQAIQLLYVITVTGSTSGLSKGGLKWAEELAYNLTKRVSLLESDGYTESPWYVSFVSAGEGIERRVPPHPIDSVTRRHVSVKQMGYDFDFLQTARESSNLIRNDIASFARRGTPVTRVSTLILSNEPPLADTDSVDGYRELCELSPIAWVFAADKQLLSEEFLRDRSQVFINHADIVEELASAEFQSSASPRGGKHALTPAEFPAVATDS